MATITAGMVAQLRERTGLGMMECKKALTETEGDLDAAIELLRKKGTKDRGERVAGEGLILAYVTEDATVGALIELNAETDFVARNDDFKALGKALAKKAALSSAETAEELLSQAHEGATVAEAVAEAVKRIGEKIVLSRLVRYRAGAGGRVTAYVHSTSGSGAEGGKVGVLVETAGPETEGLGREVAMHVSFARPRFLSEADVDPQVLAKEREIIAAQTAEDPRMAGKPAAAIQAAVEGRVRKFLGEVVLLSQPYIREEKKTIQQLVQETPGASLVRFVRFEVGEGTRSA